MNDQDAARRASVRIVFDGADITEDIKPYFLSLSYKDSEEDGSDALQIDLEDRDSIWLQSWLEKAISATAASKLKVSATITPENWGDGGSLPTGSFELDSVEAAGPPATVKVGGVSMGYSSPIRQTKKSKAWENYKLSAIAGEIAGNGGLSLVYESDSDPFYERVEQTKESDIKFLSDLCHDAGISLKCSDGQLVLFDQAAYEAKPPVLTLRRNNGRILPAAPQAYGAYGKDPNCGEYIEYRLSTGAAETQYGSCRVSYADAATGQLIEGKATAEGEDGKSGQCLEITAKVKDASEAQALAEKHLRLHNKFNRMASFTLPGDTGLVAGVTVKLEDFGGWSGKYIVKQAEHTVSTSGYTTSITLRKVLGASSNGGQSGGDKTSGEEEKKTSGGSTYTVKPGDNLSKLAKQFYGTGADWKKIYEANKDVIGGNPNLIYPGQTFTIPE